MKPNTPPPLIHIRYCRWGGHPKDNRLWEGVVGRPGDGLTMGEGWDYDSKKNLISKCRKLGYAYQVHRYKRTGGYEVVETYEP